jgi:hypothetical protein
MSYQCPTTPVWRGGRMICGRGKQKVFKKILRQLCICGLESPPGAWMPVSCDYGVLSGRDPCVGLITRPEGFYWVWCVWIWTWNLDNGGCGPLGAVALYNRAEYTVLSLLISESAARWRKRKPGHNISDIGVLLLLFYFLYFLNMQVSTLACLFNYYSFMVTTKLIIFMSFIYIH